MAGANAEEAQAAAESWLAGVERAAAVRALEEAADEIFVQHDEITAMQREAFHRGADAVYDALRARAAEIRESLRSGSIQHVCETRVRRIRSDEEQGL